MEKYKCITKHFVGTTRPNEDRNKERTRSIALGRPVQYAQKQQQQVIRTNKLGDTLVCVHTCCLCIKQNQRGTENRLESLKDSRRRDAWTTAVWHVCSYILSGCVANTHKGYDKKWRKKHARMKRKAETSRILPYNSLLIMFCLHVFKATSAILHPINHNKTSRNTVGCIASFLFSFSLMLKDV